LIRMPKITHGDAVDIAKKLRAEYQNGGKHKLAMIYYKGKKITQFGIRHDKTAGHDYVSNQIYMNKLDSVNFGKFDISYEEWIERMLDKGVIPKESETSSKPKRTIRKRHG
jgi:hypothetical protein